MTPQIAEERLSTPSRDDDDYDNEFFDYLRTIFSVHDPDGTGRINRSDFSLVIGAMRLDVSEEEIASIASRADTNSDVITFDQASALLKAEVIRLFGSISTWFFVSMGDIY